MTFLSWLFVEIYWHCRAVIFALPGDIGVPYLSFDLLATNSDHREILWFYFMKLSLTLSSISIILFLSFVKYVRHQQFFLVTAYKQLLLSIYSDSAAKSEHVNELFHFLIYYKN